MSAFKAALNNYSLIHNDKGVEYPIVLKAIKGSRLNGTQYEKGENPIDPDYVSDYDFRGIRLEIDEIAASGQIVLPEKPDKEKIDALMLDIYSSPINHPELRKINKYKNK